MIFFEVFDSNHIGAILFHSYSSELDYSESKDFQGIPSTKDANN